MSEAVTKFITAVAVHFPRPKSDSEGAEREWFASMVRNLRGFAPEVLTRAAGLIVDQRSDRRFPLPKECKAACFEAEKLLKAERPRLIGSQPISKGATNEDRERLAYELLLGPMGRRAAKEGWIHSLFTWTRDHMGLPSADHEIKFCIDGARGFDQEFERCRAAPPGSLNAKLVPLGLAMLAKRQALTDYVQTGVMP